MKSVAASLALAGAASAAALYPRQASSSHCCFDINVSGSTAGPLGQLGDGQNRVGSGYSAAQYCFYNGTGTIVDGSGRGCIATPPTSQFQCDAGLTASTASPGITLSNNGSIAHNGSYVWYECNAANQGYNIYSNYPGSAATGCSPVILNTVGSNCSAPAVASSSKPATSSAPATSSKVASSSSAPASSAPASSAPATSSKPASSSAPASSAPASSAPATSSKPASSSAPASSAPASSAPATSSKPASSSAPASSAPTSSAPATSSKPASSAPASSAPATTPVAPAPSSSVCIPTTVTVPASTVTLTVTVPATSTAAPKPASSSAPASSAPASSAPASSAPASSPKPASSSAPATSAPAPASSSAAPKPASSSAPAPAPAASACPVGLGANYQYPHLIVPVSSAHPTTAYGTQYFATINGTTSTIFNFDIPQSYAGHTCSLEFLFPTQAELETSSFTFSGTGAISVEQLATPATQSTSYSNAPAVSKQLGMFTVTPGTSTIIASGACAAGQTLSFEIMAEGNTALNYFQDYNPSPIGLYITEC